MNKNMNEGPTLWQLAEPTTPGSNPYMVDYSIPPPPPPPKKRWRIPPIVAISLTLVLFFTLSGSIIYYYSMPHSIHVTRAKTSANGPIIAATSTLAPTRTPTPVVNQNYTAVDLMLDYRNAGIHPKYIQYDTTIWSWTQDMYYVSVHATSSANWTDDSACTGYCSPANLGLWIYSSKSIAQQAYQEVNNDENNQGSIPMIGTPPEYTHGRCLLLGPASHSVYVQVMMQYCI